MIDKVARKKLIRKKGYGVLLLHGRSVQKNINLKPVFNQKMCHIHTCSRRASNFPSRVDTLLRYLEKILVRFALKQMCAFYYTSSNQKTLVLA